MTGITHSLFILILVILLTWLTRIAPFALFAGRRLPRPVAYLGKALPPAVMTVLVVYCFKSVSLAAYPFGLAELISAAVVAALHLWKRNTFLSIGCGVACYMLLIRTLFAG